MFFSLTGAHHDRHARGGHSIGHGIQAKASAARLPAKRERRRITPMLVCGLHTATHCRGVVGSTTTDLIGKKETGPARRFLFGSNSCKGATADAGHGLPNVVPLEHAVGEHHVNVDTPDTRPLKTSCRPKEKRRPRPGPRSAATESSLVEGELRMELFFCGL